MSALPYQLPIFRAEDASGASLPFALLYTYAAGTTTPLVTYQDAAGTIPNSNPVICDANGLAIVFMTAGTAYKFVLEDQYGTIQPKYPQDNLIGGATGLTGLPGSTWRDGAGVPSNATGIDGDYYLNRTNGDVYKRATGIYGVVANIVGPAGSAKNVIVNGSFYLGLSPWVTSGVVAPTLGTGSTALLGAAQEDAAQNTGVSVTSVGSISQSFSIGAPIGTQLLTFNTACYLESVASAVSNSGYVKAYVYNASTGAETLVTTVAMTAISNVPAWTPTSIDITSYLPALGDYGVRFEISATANNTGGTAGTKGTITAVDDIKLVVSTGGTVGPVGPVGPAGPGVGTGAAVSRTIFSGSATSTSGAQLMGGLGTIIKFTPTLSNRIHIHFAGALANSSATHLASMIVCYGTGTPPTAGTTAPGTGAIVNDPSAGGGQFTASHTSATASAYGWASIDCFITGLTPGTAYWFDYAVWTDGTGTASLVNPTYSIFEM